MKSRLPDNVLLCYYRDKIGGFVHSCFQQQGGQSKTFSVTLALAYTGEEMRCNVS